jgi:hypothetical protein
MEKINILNKVEQYLDKEIKEVTKEGLIKAAYLG